MSTSFSLADKQKSEIAIARLTLKVQHVFLEFLRNALRWVVADATLMGLQIYYLSLTKLKHGTSADRHLS